MSLLAKMGVDRACVGAALADCREVRERKGRVIEMKAINLIMFRV